MKVIIEVDEEHIENALDKLELLDKIWVDIVELRAITEDIYEKVKDSARKD